MKYVVNRLQRLFSNTIFLLVGVALVCGIIAYSGVRAMQSKDKPNNSGCQGICVSLKEDGMDPDTLTVKLGEYVQFNSADGKSHNISLGKGAAEGHDDTDKHEEAENKPHEAHDAPHDHVGDYSSGEFKSDEAWRVQFNKTGTYRLHDHYNPKQEILVVVYEPGGDNKIR